jgi:hypothetical protein
MFHIQMDGIYICEVEYCALLLHNFALHFFAEHMLFYASEKYPVEDSYSKYI